MGYKILSINPGSTSTKMALYDDETPVFTITLRHPAEEIAKYANIIDQFDWRKSLILEALKEKGFDVKELSAVIGRGGLVKPLEGGVYTVNEALKADLRNAKLHHASNLGGLLAEEIAREVGVGAFIADPVVVDELCDEARITGLKELPRTSIFHALNQRAIARKFAKEHGKKYEDLNLIVVHMGGGITIGAHMGGRVIDVNNGLNGDGPISPERAGSLPAGSLVDLCFSGKYSQSELQKMLAGKGGFVDLLGTNSAMDVETAAMNGDKDNQLVLNAMCYGTSKYVGSMAAVLKGKVDGILLTGGIAYSKPVVEYITEHCSFIAPIKVYPGEDELEALTLNALSVLRGEVSPKIYA